MKKNITSALILIGLLLSISVNAQNAVEGTSLNIYNPDNLENSVPNNSGSAAIGKSNTIEGNFSFAAGESNVLGTYTTACIALGGGNNISSNQSVSMGYDNIVSCLGGVAIGKFLHSAGARANFVIGEGISEDLPLRCSKDHCIMIGFNSTKPTLFVSESLNNDGQTELTGRIAIGDVNPSAKLHIRSDIGEDAGIILEPKDTEASNTFIQLRDEDHTLAVDNVGAMMLSSGDNPMALQASNLSLNATDVLTLNGKVGVNIENTYEGLNYAFAVSGGILADKVFIQQVDQWHDAVFSTDYKLMSLNDLKLFVQANHHLPEVPSEAEVLEQGYDMAEMQGILLKKIEELTLYILQQEERITELENELKAK